MIPIDTVYGARAGRDAVGNVDLSNFTSHVPRVLYLKPMLKRKPLGQAIAAVFVSTFSMITAIKAVFTFVASSFVTVACKRGLYHVPRSLMVFIDCFSQQCIARVPPAKVIMLNWISLRRRRRCYQRGPNEGPMSSSSGFDTLCAAESIHARKFSTIPYRWDVQSILITFRLPFRQWNL
jgi:hypothetical protein